MIKIPIVVWIATASFFVAAFSLGLPACSYAGSLSSPVSGQSSQQKAKQPTSAAQQKKPAPARFQVVLDGTAVRDTETGIIWEQSPDPDRMDFDDAVAHCKNLELAGMKNWRLPTIDELSSLVDFSVLGSPKLPPGHPFDTSCKLGGCVEKSTYWTQSTCPDSDAHLWLICFCGGEVEQADKSYENYAWCAHADINSKKTTKKNDKLAEGSRLPKN